MTTELLARLGAEEVESVRERIRQAHAELPEEKCMAWRHAVKYPSKEGGCDIHKKDRE